MKRSPEELAQTERFEQSYANLQSDAMLSIERQVCGCDYGGNSWTTRDEAQRIGVMLGLRPDMRLLDVGSGSGWPGLYLAEQSGCDLTLVDLPLSGLKIMQIFHQFRARPVDPQEPFSEAPILISPSIYSTVAAGRLSSALRPQISHELNGSPVKVLHILARLDS